MPGKAWSRRGAAWRVVAATARAVVACAVVACTVVACTVAARSPAGAGGADFAESCLTMPFPAQLAAAVRRGASVIVALGAPTGKSVAVNHAAENNAAGGMPAFYAMALRSVRTLRGPAVASGET